MRPIYRTRSPAARIDASRQLAASSPRINPLFRDGSGNLPTALTRDYANNNRDSDPPPRRLRPVYLTIAYVCTALGLAGVVLPLLPATPFFLAAVWAASRGSRRVHDWIYHQPWIARLLDNWHQQGAVPLSAKWLASAMMIASLGFLAWKQYHWGFVLAMSLFFLCIAGFLWSRPNPRQ